MTTYGAYNAGLPCKNPNCKSEGTPHPNCQCYPGRMAKGGEVTPFCSEGRAHESGCQYYAEGGEVAAPQVDPSHAIAGYMAHQGFHGLLKMPFDKSENPMEKYEKAVQKGHKTIKDSSQALFNNEKLDKVNRDKEKEGISKWLEDGGIDQEMSNELHSGQFNLAEGGEVKKPPSILNHPINQVSPDQGAMLGLARGRIGNYLNGLRPKKHAPRKAFDEEPDQTQQKKTYEKAIHMAAHPLDILHKIKDGSVSPDDMAHFNSMHPELNDVLQKQMTKDILKAQLEDKKPHYKVRQGLSLMMGTPLSSEMTPQNIMAAQATFLNKQPQSQEGGEPQKKKKASLDKASQSLMTGNQSLVGRSQKQ